MRARGGRAAWFSALALACLPLAGCLGDPPACGDGAVAAYGAGGQTTNGLCGAGGQTTNGITARVRLVEGEPAAGAKAYLIDEAAWEGLARAGEAVARDSAVADAQGLVSFRDLPASAYALQIGAQERGALIRGLKPGEGVDTITLKPLRRVYAAPPFAGAGALLVEGAAYACAADSAGRASLRLPPGSFDLYLRDSLGLRPWRTLDPADPAPADPDLYVASLNELPLDDFEDGDDRARTFPIGGFGQWIEESFDGEPPTSILRPRLAIRAQGTLRVDYTPGDTAIVSLEMRRADRSERNFRLGEEMEALCLDVRGEAEEFTVQLHDMLFQVKIIASVRLPIDAAWQTYCIPTEEWSRYKDDKTGAYGSDFQKITFISRKGTRFEIDNVRMRGKDLRLY